MMTFLPIIPSTGLARSNVDEDDAPHMIVNEAFSAPFTPGSRHRRRSEVSMGTEDSEIVERNTRSALIALDIPDPYLHYSRLTSTDGRIHPTRPGPLDLPTHLLTDIHPDRALLDTQCTFDLGPIEFTGL